MKNLTFLLLVSLASFISCKNSTENSQKDKSQNFQQTIYFGGDIVTMEGDSLNYAEAVVQKEGKIIFVGTKSKAFQQYEAESKKYDLKGETMMPGFIEPHAHPVSIGALTLANDIASPHEWRMPHKTYPAVKAHDNYLKAIKNIVESKTDNNITAFIWGYHKSWHGDLTLKDLDEATGDFPTIIWQRSGHEIFINSAAMKKYNIQKTDLEEHTQVDWDNNHFWERAYQRIKTKKLADIFANKKMLQLGIERLTQMMLQNGITAMSEPGFPITNFENEYAILKEGAEKAKSFTFYLIAGFPEQYTLKMSASDFEKKIKARSKYDTEYIKFQTNQYKTFGDGAIYSLALQLQDGFYNCPNCHGEWIVPLKMAEPLFNTYWNKGYKIHVHLTGDLGVEEYLNITERAMKKNPRTDHQTTFHHLGLFTAQQAERMAKLGIEASVNPYYLWALADKYSETGMGPERAPFMVAIHELTKRNIPVSFHSDFAMAPAEPLTLAWTAINRIVASGKVMRPDQRISVYDGMKGITISAARTIGEEKNIGSIKEGKEATFTILKQNPFKINPTKIKDIPIVGIVYKGKFRSSH
ncbi:MAG TPA: amidohydrolase [Saprospiraceae bacterium]|nr:amidohydrolase [Saprospiraceae bacterium]